MMAIHPFSRLLVPTVVTTCQYWLLIGMLVWLTGALLARAALAQQEVELFQDDFEQAHTLTDLFPQTEYRWTYVQRTYSANKLTVDSHMVHTGTQALRFYAIPSTDMVSKASMEHGQLDVRAGERVTLAAWVYIPDNQSLDSLFLFDFECMSCWPPNSPYPDMNPGIRLMLEQATGYLAVERGKIGYTRPFRQPQGAEIAFPRDRWVFVEWTIGLSIAEDGDTEVWLDGQQVLRGRGVTMPNPALFAQVGVQLQSPIKYDRLQVGITANVTPGPVVLYLDDITVTREVR